MVTVELDMPHLQSWVGKTMEVADELPVFPARALAAALDRESLPVAGSELPVPWHWLYFLETPRRSRTGIDGHPERGGFLPPVPLPRRMWASGAMQVERALRIGHPARKLSTVHSVEEKEGASGPLVFVTVQHEIFQDDTLCIRERQSLVYREAAAAPQPTPVAKPAALPAEWRMELTPDPVLLFRYSALTYNGHRIHYDRSYATATEFYSGLVVHGPLLATLLTELAALHLPGRPIRAFEFRATRPSFAGDPIAICGRSEGEALHLWIAAADGGVSMTGKATLGPAFPGGEP